MTTPLPFLTNKLSRYSPIKSSNRGLLTRLISSLNTKSYGIKSFGGYRTINTTNTISSEKSQKRTEIARLSGPYSMFGPGRIVQSVSNTTSFNQRTTEYKIIYSNTNHFTFSGK